MTNTHDPDEMEAIVAPDVTRDADDILETQILRAAFHATRNSDDQEHMQVLQAAHDATREPEQVFNGLLPPRFPDGHLPNNPPRSAMDNAAPNLRSTPAPALVATPMTSAAARFIDNNTVHDTTLPSTDECPICLDSYTEERCLRIVGIRDCTHHVGANCLQQMLCDSPRAEKRCPLCRAVWIPREYGRIHIHGLNQPAGANTPTHPAPAMHRRREQLLALHAQRSRPEPIRTTVNPAPVRQNRMVIDSDSDSEDYATILRNYQDFTRDVENVRDRAQNTRPRRPSQPRHRRVGVSVNSSTSNDDSNGLGRSNTSGGGAGGGNGNGNRALNRIMNTGCNFNPFRPPTNDTSPPTNPTADSPTLPTHSEQRLFNSSDEVISFSRLARERQALERQARENSRTVPPTRFTSSPLPSSRIPRTTQPPRFPEHFNPGASPLRNHGIDMADENDLAPVRPAAQADSSTRRSNELERRDHMLNCQEIALKRFEFELNARQAVLERREKAMFEDGRALQRRETAMIENERQRADLVDLLKKQRRELDRLLDG